MNHGLLKVYVGTEALLEIVGVTTALFVPKHYILLCFYIYLTNSEALFAPAISIMTLSGKLGMSLIDFA